MGNSSLSNKAAFIVLAGVATFQLFPSALSAEVPRPFPVLGSVSVQQGRWNDTPELLDKLADKVVENIKVKANGQVQ